VAVALGILEGGRAIAVLVADDAAIGEDEDRCVIFAVDVPLAHAVGLDAQRREEADGRAAHAAEIDPKFTRTAAPNGGVGLSGKHVHHFLVGSKEYAANFAGLLHLIGESLRDVRMT